MRPARLSVLSVSTAAAAIVAFSGCTVEATPEDAQAEQAGTTSGVETKAETTDRRGRGVIVASVIDGDTITLEDGRTVRLVQIDAPETDGECYSRKAGRVLRELLPPGTEVRLEADPKLDRKDRYGRLLRYVWKGNKHINLVLVQRGAASVWFYQGERGRYAKQLLRAANRADTDDVGLWQACRGTVLDPLHAIRATSELPVDEPAPVAEPIPEAEEPAEEQAGNCDQSYPDFCIPSPPPDIDCDQVGGSNFTVIGRDPHGFDGNDDGEGCES